MPIVFRNPGDTIRSLDVDQFGQLLIGQMQDQVVTIGNQVIAAGRGIQSNVLLSPAIASTAITGPAGSTTYNWQIVAVNADGDALVGVNTQITNGPPSLSQSNYVTLNWAPVAGATSYKVLRGASPGALVATITALAGQTANYSYNDIGVATSAYIAATASPGGQITAQGAITGKGVGSAGVTGAPTATYLVGGTASGAPTTGTFGKGDIITSQDGTIRVATVAGAAAASNFAGLGTIGYTQATANSGAVGATATQMFTITVPTVAGRRYKITVLMLLQQQTSSGITIVTINRGGIQINQANNNVVSGGYTTVVLVAIDVPGAGSTTYSANLSTNAGTVFYAAAATNPAYVLVEDIGV